MAGHGSRSRSASPQRCCGRRRGRSSRSMPSGSHGPGGSAPASSPSSWRRCRSCGSAPTCSAPAARSARRTPPADRRRAGAAAHADVPGLQVLVDFLQLLTPPVALAAFAGALWGGRTARRLGLAAVAWVAIVAVMAQAGYAGNPRYTVAAAAVCCVLAGVGAVRAGQALAGAPGARATRHALPTRHRDGARSRRRSPRVHRDDPRRPDPRARRPGGPPQRPRPAAGTGGRRRRPARLRARPHESRHELDGRVASRTSRPATSPTGPAIPVVVLRAPAGYTGEPSAPAPPDGADPVATAGAWSLFAACADGRSPPRRPRRADARRARRPLPPARRPPRADARQHGRRSLALTAQRRQTASGRGVRPVTR